MPDPAPPPAPDVERPIGATRAPGLDPVRGWSLAVVVGVLVGAAVPAEVGWSIRAVAGWDAALVVLLGLPWRVILRSDPETTRLRAAREDPGAVGTLAIALFASGVSLSATVILVRRPERFTPPGWEELLVALAVTAVAGAWVLMHTAYALHYAHLYYLDDGDPGGLAFGDEPPDDLDFAYVAFGIGMTFAVSDVAVTDRGIRRVVLGHAVLAFGFNTAILALAINLIFGRL
jgi:uncharacterized membrane protein